MNLIEFFQDKVGRKLLMAVATMMMMEKQPDFKMSIAIGAVGIIAIAIQAGVDWKNPRQNGNESGSGQK